MDLSNPWLLALLALVCGEYLLETTASLLNQGRFNARIPREFEGLYDAEKFAKSIEYQKANARFAHVSRTVGFLAMLAFWLTGGFNWVDGWARGFGLGAIGTGLVFAAGLTVLRFALSLPFSVYSTFVIEERFGFNRTTPKTFVSDIAKGAVLAAILGGAIFAGLVWFFEAAGPHAWLYAWIAVTLCQILIVFAAPAIIMPLFNKFSPLTDGPLKQGIEAYARSQHFALEGVYTMDGSKRSSKANAFFTGFGKLRRLALFDTLIEKQTVEELTAVVAHEIGHFKRGHIPRTLALGVLVMGVFFYAISLVIGPSGGNEGLFAAFRMDQVSIYASIIFVSIVAGPLFRVLGIATNGLSRKHEFEADEWAVRTYGQPEALATALKKLSVENLSQLEPHPLKVLLDYTHPPVLQRVSRIRELGRAREGIESGK